MIRYALLILLLCCSTQAAARMYQWTDPESGITQLSGKPPPWYRSGEAGPRVFVFERGRVIDDTAVHVSNSERERLRRQALLDAASDTEQARSQLLEARRLQAAMERDQRDQPQPVESTPEEAGTPSPESAAEETPQRQVPTEQAMKALIDQWEKMRTDNARQVIGSGAPPPAGDDSAPPPAPPAGE